MANLVKLVDCMLGRIHFVFLYSVIFWLSDVLGSFGETISASDHLYGITAADIHGKNISLSLFRDKVLLIVNVATYCGFTQSHYHDLVKIQEKFMKNKFSVLAFPCNQFGEQEPDTDEEIYEFVKDVYKVNFPVFSKIEVNGKKAHPIYKFLKVSSGKEPTWNFWKYLVDHRGKVLNAWGPMTSVESISSDIKSAISVAERSFPEDEL